MNQNFLRHLIDDWGASFLIEQALLRREDIVRNGVPDIDDLPDAVKIAGRTLMDMRAEQNQYQDSIVEPYC